MKKTMRTGGGGLMLVAAILGTAGCAPLGGVVAGPGGSSVRGDVLDGEVGRVDLRRGRLDLVAWDGRVRSLLVHRDTRVRHRRREYSVSALERGDEVRVYVRFDRRGDAWADRVDVRRSLRDRRAPPARRSVRLENLHGTVRAVDHRDGWFVVDPPGRREAVVVHLTARLDRRDEIRLDRLRRGQRVRLVVRPLDRDEVELVRFR